MGKLTVIVLLALPLLLKGLYVDNFIFEYTDTRLLGFTQVIANDAAIYAGLLLLLYLSCLPRIARWLSALLRLAAVALFAVYVVDYLVIVNFDTHLALGDAIKYAAYSHKYIQQVYGLDNLTQLAIALSIGTGIIALTLLPYRISRCRNRKLPLTLIAGLPLIAGFTDNDSYTHAWIYKNVFDYNLTIRSEAATYSPGFLQTFHHEDAKVCENIAPQRKNIIILMVESLSSYQSRYFSGIRDWTPQLDVIAAEYQAFRNFYANGFITEDGEIALLTGLPPIYPPSSYSDDGGVSFAGFYGIRDSLPSVLKTHGYKTEFLTSADLEFGNTGPWARSIGFDYVEGHDHPDYQRWERFHFQAAPDEALYNRALDRIKQQKNRPFLQFIKTVSTHHPYVDPDTKHKSEAEAFQYADRQLGRFYRQLRAGHFFDNGVLLIVGDHHSMTPLKKQEAERFGHFKAAAKVPLVVVGAETAHRDEDRQYQQTDVFNSLRAMVSGQACHDDWNGQLWGDRPVPPQYIAHRRGDNRDMISVFSADDAYLVKLDGDATRVSGQHPIDANLRQRLADKINALRIARTGV